MDISQSTIDYAKNQYTDDGLKFILGDILHIDSPDNFFDIIVCFETIEHIRDYNKALSEIKRVLNGSGLLIISSPNRRLTSPGKSINEPPNNKYHYVEFSKKEFVYLLSEKFKIIGLYGQRPINKIFLISFLENILRKFLPKLYSPGAGSSRVLKHSFFSEYRYLIATCINLKEQFYENINSDT
jgi:ubiquinone/menaquinone biosynthesis C-methylase UbiE